jgi:hypothetical protein
MRTWIFILLALVVGCSEPVLVRTVEELSILREIETAFGRSVDAEKSAVLAQTDEQSEAFAAESKAAAAEVDGLLVQLRERIAVDDVPAQRKKLAALDRAWLHLRKVDDELLALAVANTNLKALRLASEESLPAVDRVTTALEAVGRETTDPGRLRELSAASVAALRVQTLLPLHISSSQNAEMDALERRIDEQDEVVERVLRDLASDSEAPARSPVESANAAWAEERGVLRAVIELSRENTNLRSFDLSIGAKRAATAAFRGALAALVDELRSDQPGTR